MASTEDFIPIPVRSFVISMVVHVYISIVEKKSSSFNCLQMAGEVPSLDLFKFRQKEQKIFKRHMAHEIWKETIIEGFVFFW